MINQLKNYILSKIIMPIVWFVIPLICLALWFMHIFVLTVILLGLFWAGFKIRRLYFKKIKMH
jgi:hypothetical protein